MTARAAPRVHVQGAGKMGRALARALRAAGWDVSLRASRRGRPRHLDADVVLLAVRDGQLPAEAEAWQRIVPARAVVLHVAGALGPDVLAPLRGRCSGVGQMHPLVSVASRRGPAGVDGAYALVAGDPHAQRWARRVARAAGMKPWRKDDLDRVAYHAAAWLVAGGAAALCNAARDILVGEGIAPRQAEKMLAPLLRSVADNVDRVGLPEALSGVVRRGDVATLRKHVHVLSATTPENEALYLAAARAQIGMARDLGDASPRDLKALDRELACARGEYRDLTPENHRGRRRHRRLARR